MIEQILKYPLLYRIYQKSVRTHYSEYDFFKYIFSKLEVKNIRVLDLCCGDSYILDFIKDHISDYLGVDNSDKYINFSKKKWEKFKFFKLDLNKNDSIEKFKSFKPNFIFINGAIHHLDDGTVKNINKFINEFKESIFLSVDPIYDNNKIINTIMLKFDRGKYIRTKNQYENLMKNYNNLVIDDFFKMSYKNIFHYKNFDLIKLYYNFKTSLKV